MRVRENFMYYTSVLLYTFVKNPCLLDFFVHIPSIYSFSFFLPPALMYIVSVLFTNLFNRTIYILNIDMQVSANFMYHTNLVCLLDFFVHIPSIYSFLPPVLMYIVEF